MFEYKQFLNFPHIQQHARFSKLSSQSQRDFENIQKRIVKVGSKVDFVNYYVDKFFGIHVNISILTSIAKIIEQKYNVPIDRLAKRSRKAMLCWYAENWSLVTKILDDMKTNIKQISRRPRKVEKDLDQILDAKIDIPSPTVDPTDLSYLLNFHSE